MADQERGGRAELSRRQVIAAGVAGLAGGGQITGGRAQASPAADDPAAERVIIHAMGETTLIGTPQRVVVLDGPPLDAALALGVVPVGATLAGTATGFPAYLADQLTGVEKVGTIAEPDLEAIVALQPDLILSYKFRHEALYAQLSEIAPTVFADTVGTFWREDFLLFAAALNRTDGAATVVGAYDDAVAALAADLGPALAETTVSVVRFRADDVRIYFPTSFIGTILEDIGLPRPPSQATGTPEERFGEISLEQVREIDAAVIFVSAYGDPAATPLASFASDPLWQLLAAVENERVYWVDDETWMVAIGYLAADRVLADLRGVLIEGVPATPLPVA